MRHDGESRRWYDGLREGGEPGNVAVVAVTRKVLLQFNAVARGDTPWVSHVRYIVVIITLLKALASNTDT